MPCLPWVCRVVFYCNDFCVNAVPEDEGEWVIDGDSLSNPELSCLHFIFKEPGRFEACV